MPDYALGWNTEREEKWGDHLANTSAPRWASPTFALPDVVDPRQWMRIEDQRQTSSCVGHATSTAAEMVWNMQTGKTEQLSRWMAYISAQKEDAIQGDSGATITGTVMALEKRGICLESLAPFTGQYHRNISSEAWEDAETRQVQSHSQITTHQQAIEWIGGGMGAVIVGVPVDNAFMQNRGRIDRVPSSGGGHAMAIIGYDSEKNLILANSWGNGWGASGWAVVTQQAFSEWCRMARSPRAEVWGVSDMEQPEPRQDWWKRILRV